MKKEAKVKPLVNGIVIDHIPGGRALTIARILELDENLVTLGMNVSSSKMGKKDYLKIEDRELTNYEINKISIVAPNATVSFIVDGKIDSKINVELPSSLINIVKCNNPNCITRQERVITDFSVLSKEPIEIKCKYCERNVLGSEVELL